jgi:inner membrane protein
LLWAGTYLGLAGVAKTRVDRLLARSLTTGGVAPAYFSTPTPFNALLWYAVAAGPGGYRVGYRSVFEPPGRPTAFTFFPRADSLLRGMNASRDVALLRRFADGYYTVERQQDTTHFNVLRFGQVFGWQRPGAPFAFRYRLGGGSDNALVVQRGRFRGWNAHTPGQLYHRIFLFSHDEGTE